MKRRRRTARRRLRLLLSHSTRHSFDSSFLFFPLKVKPIDEAMII